MIFVAFISLKKHFYSISTTPSPSGRMIFSISWSLYSLFFPLIKKHSKTFTCQLEEADETVIKYNILCGNYTIYIILFIHSLKIRWISRCSWKKFLDVVFPIQWSSILRLTFLYFNPSEKGELPCLNENKTLKQPDLRINNSRVEGENP